VHEFLAEQPAPDPADDPEWERDFRQRLFEVACGRVRPAVQEATWQAFWRTAVAGESPAEVASALNLTAGAVYVARSRVLARLREEIHRLGDQDPPADPVA